MVPAMGAVTSTRRATSEVERACSSKLDDDLIQEVVLQIEDGRFRFADRLVGAADHSLCLPALADEIGLLALQGKQAGLQGVAAFEQALDRGDLLIEQ
jgi:hypothetical protein